MLKENHRNYYIVTLSLENHILKIIAWSHHLPWMAPMAWILEKPGLLLFLAFSKWLGQQNSSTRHGPDILLLATGKEEKAACASHLKEEVLPTSSFIQTTQTTVGTGALRELSRCPGLEVLPVILVYTSTWHWWLRHLIQVQVFLHGA